MTLIRKTYQLKEDIKTMINICENIMTWNETTRKVFFDRMRQVVEEAQSLVSIHRELMKQNQNDNIVETHINSSVDLFSGAEHLKEIFEKLRYLSEQIPMKENELLEFERAKKN